MRKSIERKKSDIMKSRLLNMRSALIAAWSRQMFLGPAMSSTFTSRRVAKTIPASSMTGAGSAGP